jgi:hypothetical protein
VDKEEELREGCWLRRRISQAIACKVRPRTLEALLSRTTGSTSLRTAGANTAHYNMSLSTSVRLVLYRRGRVLKSPFSAPDLRCHYTRKESHRQYHRLTAEAHARSSSRNPLELEVDDAKAASRSMKYQFNFAANEFTRNQLTATC